MVAPNLIRNLRPSFCLRVGRSPSIALTDRPVKAENAHSRVFVSSSNQAPYLLTRSEELNLSSSEAPALTITADPSNSIVVAGSDRSDWFVCYCARAEGNSEAEARERLQQVSLAHLGSLVQINRISRDDGQHTMSSFLPSYR